MIEKYYSPKRLSSLVNCPLSEEQVRQACHRATNPIPHITTGEYRPRVKIRLSSFLNWLENEERVNG